MAQRTLSDVLADIDLFSGLPETLISDLIQAGATIHTPGGHRAVCQGSDDAGLQVILRGSATVTVNGVERGPELGQGDYFGEISVIDGLGRSATLTAGEQGLDTFTISPLNFWSLVDRHPSMAHSLLRALCARIRTLDAGEAAVAR
ncbi:cyclic nucleotide-binding domain-containing protein [Pedococcus sp. 5OH_020]|uniref:cyclic nucleotide-binding domain-containing protein n=1 Tax=Pedococcus sp. 5OH_020 TaxID=2989814 RepID=UPI0022E9B18E|nr:cyclic nucleotide-binding domain-containing protein [Pedococcus sp. 5OH_020]